MSRTVTYEYKGDGVYEEVDSTAWDGVKPDAFKDDKIWFEADDKTVEAFEDTKMSCRETVLEEAKRCICQDRQNKYGAPEDSFFTIAQLWSTYLAGEHKLKCLLSKEDVALMMVLLKIARTIGHTHHVDNYVDMAGYAALAAELAAKEAPIDEHCD